MALATASDSESEMRRCGGAGGQAPCWRHSYAPGPRPGPAGPVGWEARAGRASGLTCEAASASSSPGPAGTGTSWHWCDWDQKILEEEAGGSGWDARKQKSEFLQRVSITIAKGNSRVLEQLYAPRLAIFHRTRLGH